MTGTPARSSSTTELRPATHSGPPSPLPLALGLAASRRSAARAVLCALWYGRSSARGVGPLPSRPLRRRPPEPAVGLPLPDFLIAPRRLLLPAISCPFTFQRAPCGGVLDLDAGGSELVADAVGRREVLGGPRLLALRDERLHEGVERRVASPLPPAPVHGSASGSRPSTSSIARTDARSPRSASESPSASELVALGDDALQRRQRGRRGEVVVHGLDELRARDAGGRVDPAGHLGRPA